MPQKALTFRQRRLASGATLPQQENRLTAARRGYNRQWQQLRDFYIRLHPVCEVCKIAPAVEVHHKESIKRNPARRLDQSNLLAVCRPCHDHIEHHGLPKEIV